MPSNERIETLALRLFQRVVDFHQSKTGEWAESLRGFLLLFLDLLTIPRAPHLEGLRGAGDMSASCVCDLYTSLYTFFFPSS